MGEALAELLRAVSRLEVTPGTHATIPPGCDVALVPAGREHELRRRSSVAIVAVGPDDVDAALTAFRAGARGYVSTTASSRELVDALLAVARGGTYLADRLASDIGRRFVVAPSEPAPDPAPDPLACLSPRQRDVLELLATGADRASIAAALGLSVGTVRTHLRDAFIRLGVHSSIEAMSVVVRAKARLARTA